jgi:hypothetical protein
MNSELRIKYLLFTGLFSFSMLGLNLWPQSAQAANTLSSPAASTSYGSSITVDYTIDTAPDDVRLVFDNGVDTPITIHLSSVALHPSSFTFNPASIVASSGGRITSASAASLPDGTYDVSLKYEDAMFGSPTYTTTNNSVTIDTVTTAPILISPTTSSTVNSLHLQYSLPETPYAGSVRVTFTDASPQSTTFTMGSSTSVNITFTTTSSAAVTMMANPSISSISPASTPVLADGVYAVTLSYQDALGNTAATAVATGVTVDSATAAPTLTSPTSGTTNSLHLQYTLPESPLASSVQVIFTNASAQTSTFTMGNSQSVNLTFSPTSTNSAVMAANPSTISNISSAFSAVLPDGVYSVSLRYQDAAGNSVASASASSVTIDATAPVITLLGESTVAVMVGTTYTDAGATAFDATNGDLTSSITVTNPVNTAVVGSYTVSYNVSDGATNAATTVTRTVNVVADTGTDDDVNNDADNDSDQEESLDDSTVAEAITTNGKFVIVQIDGVTVDQAQVGNKRLAQKYYKLVTKSIYQNYTSIIILTATKKQAKVTVFRLTSDHELKKKFDRTFAITQRQGLRLKVKASKKKITASIGRNDQQVKKMYHLTTKGKLKTI